MKEENQEAVNLLDYSYKEEEITVKLKSNTFLGLMQILDAVVKEGTQVSFLNAYPSEVAPKMVDFDGKKVLDSVDIAWEKYPNANSFFTQIPVETTTYLGTQAMDLLGVLQRIHFANIQSGEAIVQNNQDII